MKSLLELLLVISIMFIIIYGLIYKFYFSSLCNNYSGINEQNYTFAITKLAKCKDSIICYPGEIKVNERNEVTDWQCTKKDSPIFSPDLYIGIFNNFINSITK